MPVRGGGGWQQAALSATLLAPEQQALKIEGCCFEGTGGGRHLASACWASRRRVRPSVLFKWVLDVPLLTQLIHDVHDVEGMLMRHLWALDAAFF